MPFFLDGNPTQTEISEAVNYLLGNTAQSITADPGTGIISGPTGVGTSYLYKYLAIKYADSFDGTSNFSNSCTNRLYYGVRNSNDSTESTNPADYVWYKVSGGFGTTKFLFFLTTGGRSIQFQISTSLPNPGWVLESGSSIDLDFITSASNSPANFVVIRIANNSAAPTDAEVLSAIGRLPIAGDLCTVNYNSGIYSLTFKYTTGWAVFQKYITGDLIVAQSIVGTNIAAGTITADKLYSSYIVVGGAAGDVNSGTTTINGGKITANSITATQLAASYIVVGNAASDVNSGTTTISGGKITANSVTADRLNVSSLSAISANLGTVTAGTLAAGTVFAGSLSAATGSFSGSLSAANGTFSGVLTANVTSYVKGSTWQLGFNGTSNAVYVAAGGMTATGTYTIPTTAGNKYVVTAANPKFLYTLGWGILNTNNSDVDPGGTWTLTMVVSGFASGDQQLCFVSVPTQTVYDIYYYAGAYASLYSNGDLFGGTRGFNLGQSSMTTHFCGDVATGSSLTITWYLAFNTTAQVNNLYEQWIGGKITQINTNDCNTWKFYAGRGSDGVGADRLGINVDIFSTQYA
jgi:hypothetical protein